MSVFRRTRRAGPLRPVIQSSAFLRKETVEVLRQPRLILVLVAAPFLVLLLFALGYDQGQLVPRTTFVGPAGSVYQHSLDSYTEDLRRYIINDGYTSDRAAAERALAAGDIDLMVVFPDDAVASVLRNEQATIEVLHEKLDPIQQATVQVAAEVAVAKVNAGVLERAVGAAQSAARPFEDDTAEALTILGELQAALPGGDPAAVEAAARRLDVAVGALAAPGDEPWSSGLSEVLQAADTSGPSRLEQTAQSLEQLKAATRALVGAGATPQAAEVAALRTGLESLRRDAVTVLALDPAVVVQPFRSEARSLIPERIDDTDFFAPAAIALLLQHLALTVAAMGLVNDRALGLFETFRVGPIGPGRIIVGKYLAHLLLGSTVSAVLIASVSLGLGVPFRGSIGWVAVGLVGLLSASIGLGMVLSGLARSSTQAVQFAMLVLLAGLFFGGFVLELDAFRYPVKAVSWALPVTYGVRMLRDIMLRGAQPSTLDLGGLAASTVCYAGLAWFLLRRHLRVQ